jgi:phenylacetate-CoA ligase
MGRADQRVKVRGMFVDPTQLQKLPVAHPQLERWRLCVTREKDRDVMTLLVTLKDTGSQDSDALRQSQVEPIEDSLKRMTNLSGKVHIVDSLPNDGVIVDDQRNYEQNR